MKKFLVLLILLQTFADGKLCYTPSCVRSAADIIEKANLNADPCEDFYEFACGSFADEKVPPDEESTVDSLSLMGDKLQEFLLTLLSTPIEPTEPENHKLAKLFYQSCINYDKVNERGSEPLKEVLNFIGGFPMIDNGWNEGGWEWESSVLKLRKYILKKSDNIFSKSQGANEISENNNLQAKNDLTKLESILKTLMFNLAIELGAKNIVKLHEDIEDLVDFEKNLGKHLKMFYGYLRTKSRGARSIKEFQKMYRMITWMELFSPNILIDKSVASESVPNDFNDLFYNFLKTTPKRTLANYVGWRVIQSAVFLLDEHIRLAVLEFESVAYGKEDLEQRWKFCTLLVAEKAPVAVGQYYVNEFFSESAKVHAEQMVNGILQEYKERIKTIEWIDDATRVKASNITDNMLKFIGYHKNLRTIAADNYYKDLFRWDKDQFLEMTLSYTLLWTDQQFERLYSKNADKNADWTKYSIPATVNAFYNSKDNSIQFPAAILQFPFFDESRPDSLNFGAIGSIIGHEITHAFDDLSSKVGTWPKESRNIYRNSIECLIDQYNQYRVPEVEKYFGYEHFHVNGSRTIKENVADNGGVKLAFAAFQKHFIHDKHVELIIGLEKFTSQQLFFLSFAQAFCSVERPAKMKSKVETDEHALSKFRVIGPLRNMPEFAETWKCLSKSPMNPERKCTVW